MPKSAQGDEPHKSPVEDRSLDQMRDYYLRNGHYRVDDLHKFIGAPWESVSIPGSNFPEAWSKAAEKDDETEGG